MGRLHNCCLALLLVALSPLPAQADDAAKRAKRHNTTAKKLFNLGKFKEAAAEYEKAYRAKPVPEFLANIGQCYKRMGSLQHLQKALFYFESFINNATNPKNRKEIVEEIAELKAQIARLKQARSKAQPQSRPQSRPTPESQPAEPASRPSSQALLPTTPPVAAAALERPFYKKWWFWAAVSAVVVAAGVGIGFGVAGEDTRMPQGPVIDYSSFK